MSSDAREKTSAVRRSSDALRDKVLPSPDPQSEARVYQAVFSLLSFSREHSLEELIRQTLDEVCVLTESKVGFYVFVSEDQQWLSPQTWSTATVRDFCRMQGLREHHPLCEAGVWADCLRERRAVIHNDFKNLPHRKGLPPGHAELTRELVVPVLRRDRVVAALAVGNKPADYDQRDVEIVSRFAELAWMIADYRQTEAELEGYRRPLEELVRKRTSQLEQMNAQLQAQISERQRAETALRQSRQQLQIALEERTRAAEALRQRVEELEKIMDVAPAIILLAHDFRCDIIRGNDMANRFYGSARGENLSKNSADKRRFFREGRELRAEELPMQQAAATGADVRDVELTIELPGGKRMTSWGGASPLLDASGSVRGCVGAFLDITEWKRAEKALRESEERFRAMANAIPNIAFRANAGGNIDYINEWGCRYLGLTSERLSEKSLYPTLYSDDVESFLRARQRCLATGEIFEQEYRIRRASDGSCRWHLIRCVPIRDAEGNIVCWFGTGTDIEEIKQAQAYTVERETWFRALFDTIPLSAVLIDARSRQILEFNDLAAVGLGYTREEFAQLKIDNIDADSSPQERHLAEPSRPGGLGVFEKKHRTKSGAIRDVIVYGRVMTMGGRPVSYVVWHDVTEKKAAEAALLQSEKLASVGRLAATVAHEINNPLAAVTNCVYLAATTSNQPNVQEYLDIAERELRRVAHIAKRTLGFYRETSKPILVDLALLSNEVAELYDPKLTRKDIRLQVEHRGDRAEAFVIAGEIRQVISNLLTNAIDATPSGGAVTVRTSQVRLKDRSYARISVADTGTGITADHLRRIFEPFFTTKKAFGTGLGLWVSRELVQKHTGHLLVRSAPGRGTVFSLLLPMDTGCAALAAGEDA